MPLRKAGDKRASDVLCLSLPAETQWVLSGQLAVAGTVLDLPRPYPVAAGIRYSLYCTIIILASVSCKSLFPPEQLLAVENIPADVPLQHPPAPLQSSLNTFSTHSRGNCVTLGTNIPFYGRFEGRFAAKQRFLQQQELH